MAFGFTDIGINFKLAVSGFSKTARLKREIMSLRAAERKLNVETVQAAKDAGFFGPERIQQAKKFRNEIQRFKAEYLSLMFFGMAIQRFFGGFLKGATQTFKKVAEGTDKANNGLTRMTAAFEFFKFSMIDALMNSGFFKWLTDGVVNAVQWWSELSDSTKSFFAASTLQLAAFGAAMAGAGIIVLGLEGVSKIMSDATALKGRLMSTIGAFSIFYALKKGKDAFDSLKQGEFGDAFISALSATALAIGGLRVARGAKGGGALLLVGFGLEYIQQRGLQQSMKDLFGGVLSYFVAAGEWASSRLLNVFIDASIAYQRFIQAIVSKIPVIGKTYSNMLEGSISLSESMKAPERSFGEIQRELKGIINANIDDLFGTKEVSSGPNMVGGPVLSGAQPATQIIVDTLNVNANDGDAMVNDIRSRLGLETYYARGF